MKHTKGEWTVRHVNPDDEEPLAFVHAACDANSYGIEILMEDYGEQNGYPYAQREADAKLIAAAPELLEVLIKAKNELDFHLKGSSIPLPIQKRMEEAIKKATE